MLKGHDCFLYISFGGSKNTTADFHSCKVFDDRLLLVDSRVRRQVELTYKGSARVCARRQAVMSSALNLSQHKAAKQKVFLFGGKDNLDILIDDEGFYMYDIARNTMELARVEP